MKTCKAPRAKRRFKMGQVSTCIYWEDGHYDMTRHGGGNTQMSRDVFQKNMVRFLGYHKAQRSLHYADERLAMEEE